jgi:hypothetical protein
MIENISFSISNIKNDAFKSKMAIICELASRLNDCDFVIKCCTERVKYDDSGFYGNKKKLKEFQVRKTEIETLLSELIK